MKTDTVTITDILKVIFSWIILMPIAVIIGGKFLSKVINLSTHQTQLFKIPLYILVVEARDGEVILGFTSFFITLIFVASAFGNSAYNFFKNNFGIDPGHFNSLCVISSFYAVAWTFLVFLIFHNDNGDNSINDEHKKLIDDLKKKGGQ